MTQPLDTIALSDAIGAEIRDIDLAHIDDATFTAIHDVWIRFQVLRFRNQKLTDAKLVAFSRRFGELDIAPPNENGTRDVEGFPEILVISNVVEDGVEIGSLGSGEAAWHTDMSYIPTPPIGSVLYAWEVPRRGGSTSFLNMYRVLETMPDSLRRKIEGRYIKHDATTNSAGYLRAGTENSDDVRTSPGTAHPIIITHPETGRDTLYLGRRHRAYVVDMDVDASEALLGELWSHTNQKEFTWHQEWSVGDLVMWDNRCTMHRRDAFDSKDRRIMHRTQIKGCALIADDRKSKTRRSTTSL
ncbi:MAG: TauD/TfdA family dioxygenase [Proteobacteria bacterium]|nr:MAG: TauD/TfdA family dioxygenase [Pseudomonadota bacterium]